MKPRALDLFCKAGGATRGLQRAGYHVTGVDIEDQPNYVGDAFIRADALDVLRFTEIDLWDLIWASPPCQRHSSMTRLRGDSKAHPDLIPEVRRRLQAPKDPAPYVIENVVGAPLVDPVLMCGSMFGLDVRRHRLFEATFPIITPPCSCRGRRNVAVYGKRPGDRLPDGVLRARTLEHGQAAMGIGWMTWPELTQAIPPAYSALIGRCAIYSSFRGPQGGRRTLNSPNQVRILAPDQLETKEVRPCPNPAVPVRTDYEPPGSTAPGGSCPDGTVRL